MTRTILRQQSLGTLLAASALAGMPLSAPAGDSAGDWQYSAALYLWAAGIDGETAGGAEVDVGFDTLIDNLNMAFMGALEARRARWALGADLIYLNVGANDGGTVPARVASGASANLDIGASVETKGWVVSLFGAYNLLENERVRLDALLGARYLDLELDFDLGLSAGRYRVARAITASQITWDGVVGVKGRVILDGPWSLPYYLDVGTGESDLTWQAAAGVGYAFGQAEVSLLYRHAAWDFDSGDALDDIAFSGPLLAATWRF